MAAARLALDTSLSPLAKRKACANLVRQLRQAAAILSHKLAQAQGADFVKLSAWFNLSIAPRLLRDEQGLVLHQLHGNNVSHVFP